MRGEAGAAGQAPPVPSLPPQEDLGMEMEEGEEEDDGASERGVVVMPENEPEATKRKILDFLNSHTVSPPSLAPAPDRPPTLSPGRPPPPASPRATCAPQDARPAGVRADPRVG